MVPGKPTPGLYDRLRLASSNSAASREGMLHDASQRKRLASRSTIQNCPKSQPKLSHTSCNNAGAAAASDLASARIRAATFCTISRRSRRLRLVTSREFMTIPATAGSSSRLWAVASWMYQLPSLCLMRNSFETMKPGWLMPEVNSSRSSCASSGWTNSKGFFPINSSGR